MDQTITLMHSCISWVYECRTNYTIQNDKSFKERKLLGKLNYSPSLNIPSYQGPGLPDSNLISLIFNLDYAKQWKILQELVTAGIPYLCGKAAQELEPQPHIQHPPVWGMYIVNYQTNSHQFEYNSVFKPNQSRIYISSSFLSFKQSTKALLNCN